MHLSILNSNKYHLFYYYKYTKLGWITIATNKDSITFLHFGKIKITNCKYILTILIEDAFKQLEEYFNGQRQIFDLLISLNVTKLKKQILNELTKIPYGKTQTYQDIAIKLGNKNYARIIGNTCKTNPILIIIPCHRVTAKNGNCNYVAGSTIKQNLLLIEKINRYQ